MALESAFAGEGINDIARRRDAESQGAALNQRRVLGIGGMRHGAGVEPGAIGNHLGDGRADAVGERGLRAGADADGLGVRGAGQHDGGADG